MTPATGRPERRRKSTLAGEHPAWPPRQAAPDEPLPDPAVPTPETRPGEHTAGQPPVGEDHDDTFPDTGHTPPHPRTATPRRDARANSQAEARARQTTRNAAWSWAAATRKAEQRRSEWAEQMAHARSLGTLPAILHDYVIEAAEQAGLTARDVPPEVWTAAGLPANTPTQ